jgi:hypothetical protein
MFTPCLVMQTLDDLRNYVTTTLCQHDQLEPHAFSLSERLLLRANRPCGIDFCLEGPRAVKLSAIWETQHNRIYFYDSAGERFHKIQLLESPTLESVLGASNE